MNLSITSPAFYLLVVVSAVLLRIVPPASRKGVLLTVSAIFYLAADLASGLLGILIVGVNLVLFRALVSAQEERAKDRIYYASIAFNLTAFVTLKLTFESFGAASAPWSVAGVSLAYPLGLSFVILMLHAALSDAYSGRLGTAGRPGTFVLYSLFFPYVTSGPVERLGHMQTQFEALRKPTLEDLRAGSALIALGLVKKLVVANRLGPYVTNVFGGGAPYSATTLAFAIALNVAHMYADFSGYTDIARGAARCLGIEVGENFNRPFVSRSVTEYWRRWHISFSSWLRDYLYMPMAFALSRKTSAAPSIAIFLTFLAAGFWHRAAWTFVIFGLVHGLVLALEQRFGKAIPKDGEVWRRRFQILAARGYTVTFIGLALILFTAKSLGEAGRILSRLATNPVIPWPRELFGYLGPFMFALMVGSVILWRLLDRWQDSHSSKGTPFFLLVCAAAVVFLGTDGPGFIYVQF